MKKVFKVLGIIFLALVIGFAVTACADDDDGDSGGGGGGGGGGSKPNTPLPKNLKNTKWKNESGYGIEFLEKTFRKYGQWGAGDMTCFSAKENGKITGKLGSSNVWQYMDEETICTSYTITGNTIVFVGSDTKSWDKLLEGTWTKDGTDPGTGGNTDTALNGTWTGDDGDLTFNNGNFEMSGFAKGTYTTSEGSISVTVTHIFGSEMGLEEKWYTRDELKAAADDFIDDDDLDEMFFSSTGTYSISGSTLTMIIDGDTMTLTKSGGSTNPTDITYSASPNSTSNTTAITFTFSAAVTGLTATDITITNGTGSATKGQLSGSGTSWSLGITVNTAGNVTVSINKSGIENGSKTVAVAKQAGGTNQTPTAADYNIGNLTQTAGGTIIAVTITAKGGKSPGAVSNIKYAGSATVPQTAGAYTVTFDVAAATGWNAATNLNAGTLKVISSSANSITDFATWLAAQPANSAATPYTVALNLSDLGDNLSTTGSLGATLLDNPTKFVYLDLSGSTITTIPNFAFSRYSGTVAVNLTGITIPDSVESIGNNAFSRCNNLTSVTIGSGVTSIGQVAFYSTKLTNVTIPSGVTSIGAGVFVNCTSLTAINVDSGNTSYTEVDGVLYNKSKTALVAYPAGKAGSNFTIPNNVTDIETYAFAYTGLTSVTIPNSVESIGNYAFSNCNNLTSVTIGSGVNSIGQYAFYYCASLTSVTIPSSVNSIGQSAFSNCTSLTSVTFNGTIPSDNFNYYTFDGDLQFKFFYYPNSTNGRPGTYTTTAPVNGNSEWTWIDPNAITYTATPNDSVNTTAINFTFSSEVPDEIRYYITITDGTGSVTPAYLPTGSGTSWSWGITVITAGDVTVRINMDGIESGSKTVAVAKSTGGSAVAWTDLVGDWKATSGSNTLTLKVNTIQNATIGGVINYHYNVGDSQGGGSWIQCSISGNTLKIDNGEKTFTFSLSSDKKTLTLSNSSSSANNYKLLEGVYTKQ